MFETISHGHIWHIVFLTLKIQYLELQLKSRECAHIRSLKFVPTFAIFEAEIDQFYTFTLSLRLSTTDAQNCNILNFFPTWEALLKTSRKEKF